MRTWLKRYLLRRAQLRAAYWKGVCAAMDEFNEMSKDSIQDYAHATGLMNMYEEQVELMMRGS